MYSEIRFRRKENDLEWFKHLTPPEDDHLCRQFGLARHAEYWVRYENLPEEFNLLMRKNGYLEVDFYDWKMSSAPPLHQFDELIREKYAIDFEKLGYKK